MQKHFDEELITGRFIPLSWNLEIDQNQSPKTCQAINKLVSELTEGLSTKGGSKSKRTKVYRILLSNIAYLVSSGKKGTSLTLSYSTKSEVMQRNYLGRDTVRDCIDQLVSNGFIKVHSGFTKIDKNTGMRINYTSRMKFEDKLYKRFNRLHEAVFLKIFQCIVVRDKDADGNNIDVTDKHIIPQRLIDDVMLINRVNSTAIIINENGKQIAAGQYYRVFNNSNLYHGGRFYDHLTQSLSSKKRAKLTINGEPVVEIDFSNLHPKLLYELEGVEIPDDFDAYTIDDKSLLPIPKPKRRKFLKLAVNILLNAKSLQAAQRAIIKKVSHVGKESKKKPMLSAKVMSKLNMNKICEAIFFYHSPIKHHFYGGEGIVLQNLDADIANRILTLFAEQGEPCLCVHDSFIVRKSMEHELNKAMSIAYQHVLEDNM